MAKYLSNQWSYTYEELKQIITGQIGAFSLSWSYTYEELKLYNGETKGLIPILYVWSYTYEELKLSYITENSSGGLKLWSYTYEELKQLNLYRLFWVIGVHVFSSLVELYL